MWKCPGQWLQSKRLVFESRPSGDGSLSRGGPPGETGEVGTLLKERGRTVVFETWSRPLCSVDQKKAWKPAYSMSRTPRSTSTHFPITPRAGTVAVSAHSLLFKKTWEFIVFAYERIQLCGDTSLHLRWFQSSVAPHRQSVAQMRRARTKESEEKRQNVATGL
jgi:hypothetical protein